MRTIIVDDEPLMLKSFTRLSEGIRDLDIVAKFTDPFDALDYVKENGADLALLDIEMPGMNGISLASELRRMQPDLLLVFITASDNYIREFNELDVDYYIMKPYRRETIEIMMNKLRLLARRSAKSVYIRTFGTFSVLHDGKPVPVTGKAKEILALAVTRRGKEISNEEIYSTIWEGREYSNVHMKVYYNALSRLKTVLADAGLSDLLLSTTRGQMVNTNLFDCDYYSYLEGKDDPAARFEGQFLSEYSWGEPLLAAIEK